jgi:hypothetical protein
MVSRELFLAVAVVGGLVAGAYAVVDRNGPRQLDADDQSRRAPDLWVQPDDVIDLDGQSARVGGLTGAGTIRNTGDAPATLIITGGRYGSDYFTGVVDYRGGAPLSITKTGASRQFMVGPSPYAGRGQIIIEDGRLLTR